MDSFSLISDSAYVAQVRILLPSCFPWLLLEIQGINSCYTMNVLHCDMLSNYHFILELVLFNLYIFYAIYAVRSETGVGFGGWFGFF